MGIPNPPMAESYPPTGLSPNVLKLPEWIQLGCGDTPYNCAEKNATFAPDGQNPADMPDLSKHSSFMAECLTADVWAALKDKKTSTGVTLAQCMKTGVDNPGHPHIKTVGLTACDEESYEVFKELFDPVISARHGGYAADAIQPTNLDTSQLSDTDIDPEGKYVLTTRVRTGRSVKGFQLPPTISFEDRRKLEALSVKALLAMEGDLKGEYFPLHGSKSYADKPTGMSEEKEELLRKTGNLFQEPDSTLLLASGMGRHWPDGRGVFENTNKNLFVWVGEEDHLRIVSMQGSRDAPSAEGKNIKAVTARFMDACAEVQKVLKAEGADFMHNDHLGWVLTCPSNLGTGLRAGTMVKLPKVSGRDDWKTLCAKMGLQARGTGGVDSANVGGTWDVSNADRIGKGEVDLVNTLIEGAAQLVKWESMCDNGQQEAAFAEIDAKVTGAAAAPGVTCDPEIEAKAIQILAFFSDVATQDEIVLLMESVAGSKMEGTDEEKLSALPSELSGLIGNSKEDIKAFLTTDKKALKVLDKIIVGMSAKVSGAAAPEAASDPEALEPSVESVIAILEMMTKAFDAASDQNDFMAKFEELGGKMEDCKALEGPMNGNDGKPKAGYEAIQPAVDAVEAAKKAAGDRKTEAPEDEEEAPPSVEKVIELLELATKVIDALNKGDNFQDKIEELGGKKEDMQCIMLCLEDGKPKAGYEAIQPALDAMNAAQKAVEVRENAHAVGCECDACAELPCPALDDPEIEAKVIQVVAFFSDVATLDEVIKMMVSVAGPMREGTDEEKLSALPSHMQALVGKPKEDLKKFLTIGVIQSMNGESKGLPVELLDKMIVGMSA